MYEFTLELKVYKTNGTVEYDFVGSKKETKEEAIAAVSKNLEIRMKKATEGNKIFASYLTWEKFELS